MRIDARGQGCPRPVMMTGEALSKIKEGIIEVLVDNEESALNVSGFAAQNGMFAEEKKEGKDWKVKIVKGYTCKVQSSEFKVQSEKVESKKTLLLVVGTDSLGRR